MSHKLSNIKSRISINYCAKNSTPDTPYYASNYTQNYEGINYYTGYIYYLTIDSPHHTNHRSSSNYMRYTQESINYKEGNIKN